MAGETPVRCLLGDYGHGADAGELADVQASSDAIAARLCFPDGTAWRLRACRGDAPVGDQFSGCAEPDMESWARSRMATLHYLEEAGYPAPRVVRATDGRVTAAAGGWCLRVVSYVGGTVIQPSIEQLRLLGAALGRLHALTPPTAAGRSYWHQEAAIPATLRLLAATEPRLPAEWRGMHASLRHAVEAVRDAAPALPEVIIHGDVWPANCVQTTADHITLIDWDTGGLGLAVLDLGRALLECHLDSDLPPDRPEAWLIRPDERRITALAHGYRAMRTLSAAELRLLPEAIRFGVAFVGAIHCHQALIGGLRGPGMDARLARLRNRLAVSQPIADIAIGALDLDVTIGRRRPPAGGQTHRG